MRWHKHQPPTVTFHEKLNYIAPGFLSSASECGHKDLQVSHLRAHLPPGELWSAPRQVPPGPLLCLVLTLTPVSPFMCQ